MWRDLCKRLLVVVGASDFERDVRHRMRGLVEALGSRRGYFRKWRLNQRNCLCEIFRDAIAYTYPGRAM